MEYSILEISIINVGIGLYKSEIRFRADSAGLVRDEWKPLARRRHGVMFRDICDVIDQL